MKTQDYLFAVSALRAGEESLLKESDLEQLINAPDYKKAISFLTEKGYEKPNGNDFSKMLDDRLSQVWDRVKKSASEAESLDMLIIKNDFQNLKAIIKSEVINDDARKYFVSPCVYDPEKMLESVKSRHFADLPEIMRETAEKAFGTVTKTGNGQYCDIIVDVGTLKAILSYAEKETDETLKKYAYEMCAACDLKTAYRCIGTKKNESFAKNAICGSPLLPKDGLVAVATGSEGEFSEYLVSVGFSEYAKALENGTSAFEKLCDDRLIRTVKQAKMTVFGISPLAAYYVANEIEIKCLRIILSAKLSEVSSEVIRERMRELYV